MDGFHDLADNHSEFEVLARDHVKTKHQQAIDDAESDGGAYVEKTEEALNAEARRIVEKAIEISLAIEDEFPDLNDYLTDWISFTLLNTFGIVAFNSLQRLCGTTDDRIGYLPDIDGLMEGRYGVYLYDRDEYGNGCSETMSKYFHILYLQRAIGDTHSKFLPTEDYLTILEQELLQCPQFHTDMGAVALQSEPGSGTTKGLPELGYVLEHSEEVHRISADVWMKLGIKTLEDAWKIPIYGTIPHLVARRFGLEKDDVSRATGICWTGCPECVLSDHMLLGTLRGKDYVDKTILDEWFKSGRISTEEYKSPTPIEIASGDAGLDIGSKSQVCMSITEEGEKRLMRSVSLPFTIGFIIDRHGEIDKPRLVIRDDDIIGMRLKETIPDGTGKAFAIGFGRLVWYNLLMTAYLDSIGKIEEDSKEITMVFYDISDINFDDIGISEKMIESLDYYRRSGGYKGRIESLSDIIGWLAERDFKITICLDFNRAKEPRVKGFLSRLREFDKKENITILGKKIPRASMHVKGMLTPVGALDGSANLTKSGIGKNDESVNHANIGTNDYSEIQTRLRDALYGAKRWDPN